MSSAGKKSIFFDIDGTLADCAHRLGFIRDGKKDWNSFFRADLILKDPLIEPVAHLLRSLAHPAIDNDLVLLTGRPEMTRDATVDWLRLHSLEDTYSHLLMRPARDRRSDTVVKKELLLNYVASLEQVLLIIEDRQHMVDLWRSMGLHVLHCAESSY